MGKRKRVPAALHSELSEYSSLLRALHTNDTLDVAKDITNPPKRQKPGPRAEGSSNEPPADPQSDAEQPKRKHTRKRDTWTRWPLLVTDIKVPEWGLEDEIEALMRLCLRNNPHLAVEETLDAGDTPPSLPHLAQSASNFLSSILALIALHTPARPQSMQDRLNPIGWQAVLDVLGSCGDPATVDAECVRSREFSVNPKFNITA
ncbi:hypothetical protein C8R44DRAFT_63224 [Mycena epipterygia]|nr:hypothetical protein C8R44DRAFT_63224 [Mycena epipterygia]